jgi:RES domain-containing protein
MRCCRRCFDDPFLKEHIEEHGEEGDCNYCGAQGEYVIEAADLNDLFQRFLELYAVSNDGSGESLASLLEDDWGIFSDDLIVADRHHELLQEIMKGDASEEDLLDVPDVRDLWKEGRPNESLEDRWDTFAESMKEGGPAELGEGGVLVPPNADPEAQLNDPFVWVAEDLGHVAQTIPAGTRVFRARLRYRKDGRRHTALPVDQMGAPPPDKARAGRANPEGTPFLYCAEEEATAIAEMRPARGQLVTVATGETTEELHILDFTERVYFKTPFACEYLPSLVQSYELFNRWGDDLARPLRHSDDVQDYYPTQYLAQWARAHHYDGIRYPSALAPNGHNLVIFEPNKIRLTDSRLVEIKSVTVEYDDPEPED